ncbi:hypothetical protein FE392_15390 [Xenorhabdus sp. 12]|uniref:Uncharacterized protein n=1 Tax=Xenorhabdus santafensis TaxID=2582833 RepID=A0ABU4SD11_9GAMM|nr:hypothetical protein [Xenorhabdus sp. 12]MDX7988698.1 hypothetical protein [Xenorhabdus sp. 12]
MTLEQILHDTMQEAQSIFEGKSHNISYYDINMLPEEKREYYTDEGMDYRVKKFTNLRDELLIIRCSSDKIYSDLISEKNSFLVGNCLLLTIFALQHLKKVYKQNLCQLFYPPDTDLSKLTCLLSLQLIVTDKPYNHAFALICPPSHIFPQHKIKGKYEPNVFPEGSWVCDPWANIVCSAQDYNHAWKARMAEWNTKGKVVFMGRTKTDYDNNFNYSPLGLYTYMAIQKSKKTIDEIIIIFPNGETKTKTNYSYPKCNLL